MSTSLRPMTKTPSTRLILTQVAGITLAFPSIWVAEIFQAERTQVLPLPFYDSRMLGLLHHNGQVVPLVVGDRLLGSTAIALKETLIVIQLSQTAGALAGVGIVVEHLLGSVQELETETRESGIATDSTSIHPERKTIVFDPDLMPETLWRPQR